MKKLYLSVILLVLAVVSTQAGASALVAGEQPFNVPATETTSGDFQLGSAVTSTAALSQEGRYFVLRGNAATEFTSSTGSVTQGTGPVYMLGALQGTESATVDNVVKFIPCGDGKYLLFWPSLNLYLKNSGSVYNGVNGWQYTTEDVSEAAMVEFSSLSSGDFEMYYYSNYKNNKINDYFGKLYLGAEMRVNALSKIKTFSPDKKDALEMGDYTQGYSLPIAFNWSLYAATLSSSVAASYDEAALQSMELLLRSTISQANLKILISGDFNGNGVSEKEALDNAIAASQTLLDTTTTLNNVVAQYQALVGALKAYVAVNLKTYKSTIEELLATSNFGTVPTANTYPESSRTLLNNLLDKIAEINSNINIYTPSAIEVECGKLETEIANFYSTKVQVSSLPISYNGADGLPGVEESYGGYVWSSPVIYFNAPVTTLRVLFRATINEELYNGYPMVNLGEFEIYDVYGNKVQLSSGYFSTNSQEYMEGSMVNICDGDYSTYWHSAWSYYSSVTSSGYVYLDITLPTSMQAFSFKMYGRDNYSSSKFPTDILVTTPMNILAVDNLQPFVDQARTYQLKYGSFDGKYTGDAITTFEETLAQAEAVVASPSPTMNDIYYWSSALSTALRNYVACKLDIYKAQVNTLLSTEEFCSYPKIGAYSESQRLFLNGVITNIDEVKANLDIYTIENLEELYVSIDADLETFYSSKITYLALPLIYDSVQGLPGVQQNYGGYMWVSPLIKLSENNMGVRIEFLSSTTPNEKFNNSPIIAIAEIELYDAAGNLVVNSQEASEGALKNICDGDNDTYWQSARNTASIIPSGNVCVDLVFPTPMNEYTIVIYGRDDTQYSPAKVKLSTMKEALTPKTPLNGETAYVYLKNGGVEAFAVADILDGYYMLGDYMCVPLKSGDTKYYTAGEYDSISVVAPALPEFTSYKFNNKFNPNLHVDAIASEVTNEMNFSLNSIGKWLTASFQLSDDNAVVYIDTVQQVSKETRQSFASPKTYVVTYPGYKKYTSVKVADEVWEYADGAVKEIPLTADMLATNKPANDDTQGLWALVDGDPSTKFHSTWGTNNNSTLYVDAYITVALPTAIEKLKLYYKCRNDQDGYNPLILDVFASNDGSSWKPVRTLTTADGMPVGGVGSEYTSPVISLGGSYTHLKFLQTSGEYSKNHLTLSEMRVYNVESGDSTLVSNSVYETKAVPFGREYKVGVEWLVDNATSVPRIDIDIDGGAIVTSKDYYLNANFRITGYGVYDNFEDSVQIKGRGNTSWGYSKKPYRLKFSSKVKPFGLTKGKSWVLLANAQKGSMMANAAAMKIGQMAGAEFVNHIVPVDLYMNGEYKGSYMFTEKVGMANNSVDVDEDLGYLLELDSYYDEAYKFRSTNFSLPVNIKEPDLSEYTTTAANARKSLIQNDFNTLDAVAYYGGNVGEVIDLEAFARFMLTNDLVCNQELGHPKSTYLFKEELEKVHSKIKFGPLWDFDWAFGYEGSSSYCETTPTAPLLKSSMSSEAGYKFFQSLMNFDVVKKYYYKAWSEFLDKNSMAELADYMNCYYNFAKKSFENNATVWNDGTGYAAINTRMQQWLNTRAEYIYENLDVYDLDEFNYPLEGDVNKNNFLTVHDIALATAYNVGNEHPAFNFAKADVNADGRITSSDFATIEAAVLAADFMDATAYHDTPLAKAELKVDDIPLALYEDCTVPVKLHHGANDNYKALQMDIVVPDGIMLLDATVAAATQSHKAVFTQFDMTTYRLVIYSADDEAFDPDADVVANLLLNCYMEIPAESCVEIKNILVVDEATDEYRMSSVVANLVPATPQLMGDVNSDGSVDVADVTKVISVILGKVETFPAADVNGDGGVDVADVTKIITVILGVNKAPEMPQRVAARSYGASSIISATDKGGALSIKVANPSYAFSAIQFDIDLPEGIKVAEKGDDYAVSLGRRAGSNTHAQPVCAMQPDGALRVVIVSNSNSNFTDVSGEVAAVDLNIDGVADGEYEFEIKNVKISSLGTKESLAPYAGTITVKSGIEGSIVEAGEGGDASLYDLSGRKVFNPLKKSVYIKGNKKYVAE